MRTIFKHVFQCELDSLLVLSHKLRGTAASFGFPEVGLAAGEIEEIVRKMKSGRESDNDYEILESALNKAKQAAGINGPSPLTEEKTALKVSDRNSKSMFVSATGFSGMEDRLLSELNAVAVPPFEVDGVLESSDICSLLLDLRSIPNDTACDIARKVRLLDETVLPTVGILADMSVTPASALYLGASMIVYSSFETMPGPMSDDDVVASIEQLRDFEHERKPRVLLVDDDNDFCSHVEKLLSNHGISVRTVSEVDQILHAIESFKPMIMLLDISLSSTTSGIDVCAAIREDRNWHHLPIIFLSARVELESRLAALQAGGDDFIAKPIDEVELIASVRKAIKMELQIQSRWQNDALSGLKTRAFFLEDARRVLHQSNSSVAQGHSARLVSELVPESVSGPPQRQPPCAVSASPAVVESLPGLPPGPTSVVSSLCLLKLNFHDEFSSKFQNASDANIDSRELIVAKLGQLIRYRLRAEDVRGKWSDDQFVILMPGIDSDTASQVLTLLSDELQILVGEVFDPIEYRPELFSFTAGLAASPLDGATIETLLIAADTRASSELATTDH
ncbi:MAG: response regulator [Candidatus Melainabacteria bacterium]|nr:response regulator [Candidatus Melainabacteria bacterium]